MLQETPAEGHAPLGLEFTLCSRSPLSLPAVPLSPVGTEQIPENRTRGPAPGGQGGAWAAQDPQGKGLERSGLGSSVGRATVSTHLHFQPPLKAPGPSEGTRG